MQNHYTTPQELNALHDRGVHFVLCRSRDVLDVLKTRGKRKGRTL